jgi:hypothetical protein
MKNDPQNPDPATKSPDTCRRLVGCVVLLILACPYAALAAGTGAFLGMSVAVAGWGQPFLHAGAAAGAGFGAVLTGVVLFVARNKEPKIDPAVHAEKLTAYFLDMKGRGVEPKEAAPLLFRGLWMMGLQVPPPLFLGFWTNFLWGNGIWTAIVMLADAVLWWEHPNIPMWFFWLTALVLILPPGIGALVTRSPGRKYQFPSWDDYPPVEPGSAAPSQRKGTGVNG